MTTLFDGLHGYEIALFVLGAILFLALTFGLVYSIINKRSIAALAVFFPFPIIMIGFPAVSKIRFDRGVIEIEKTAEVLAQNPTDTQAREHLERAVAEIEQRPITAGTTHLAIARAQAILGQREKALANVHSALRINPNLAEAARLRETLLAPPAGRPQ